MKRSLMSFVGFGRYLSACAMPILLVALAVAPSAALATDIYILKKSSGSSYNWGDAIWSASDAQTSGGSTWTSFSESANNWARIGYAGCTHTINLQNQTVVLGYLYPRDGTLTIQNGTFQFPSTCDTRGVHPYADVAYTSVSFTGGAAGILLDVSPGSSRYYESCTFGTSPKFSIAYNKNGDSVEPHKTGFKDVQAAFNQLRCYVGTESQSAMDGQRHIFGVTNSVLEFASVNMNNGDAYAEWLDMSVKLGANNKDNAKAAFDVSGTLCVKGTSANPSTLAIDATGMGVGVYKVVRAGTVSDSTLGTFKVTTLTLPDGTPVNVNAMVNATDASGTVSGSATVKNYALTYASGVLTLTLSGNKIAYTASGYTGTADGNPHGITVTVTKPTSGYTVRYGNTAGTYDLTTSPTLTTVGSKTVYFRITADDYDTETGSATILIEHAPSPGVITTNAIPSHADWGYEIHGLGTYGAEVAVVFTNTTATMTRTLPTGLSELHYLVVGGGGGGGYCSGNANSSGGGGGAGDFVQATINDASQVSGAQLSVTVGRGGGGTYGYDKNYVWNGNYSWVKGTNGTDSVLSISGLEYRAYGGGGGGSGHNGVGASGGSGGGGSAKSAGGSVVTGGRGNIGGTAYTVAAGAGGGGGGAGGEGTAGTSSTGGSGGDGLPSTITGGESVYYAAGGGAGAAASNGIDYRGKGGKGGGGDGGYYSSFTTRQGTSATFYGSGGGGSCNYGNSSDNYKYRSGNGYQGVVIVRYTEPSLYYFTHENNPSPNPVWGQANHWFADEARGVAKGAYPDSYAADVYFGSSSTWPSQTCVLNSSDGHTGADFHLGRLTMAGGNVIIGEKGVTLYFPPDGAADTPIVLNNGGNLFFSFMFLSGVGVIQCAADATNQFGTAILGADSHIGVTNVLSAGQRATTVISPRKIGSDARIPSVLSFLSTGAADSTTDLVVSNASVHLTSPTVASGGAGKLAMNLVVGPLNARNAAYEVDSTTVMFDVDGTLDIASGSTLDIDASRVSTVFSLTNTYDLIRYGACATAGNLAVNDLILPNGTTVALGTTLQDLATTPSVGVSDGYAYTLQCADNTLTLTFQRQLTLDHVEISFDGTTWAWFDSSVTTNVGYYANTPQYRAIYTGWAAGDGPSVRIDNICTGYKQGDTPGTENGHAAWDGTYDVYVPKNYATVVHGMPTVPAGYSASAFDNLTLGTVTLNPLVFTWNKTEDDVWGAPANWDRNYTTPGCTNVPSSKYDTVSFSNRTAVVTVDGTYTIGRYCDTATSDVTIQGVSPNRVTYLAHETTAAPMPMELLGKLVVRALGDDGYSPFKVTRWICEAYHNNVARPVLVMEGLHEHCAAEGDRAANYGGVRTFVIKDCQINMTYAISRPSDVWNEQKGTYAKVLMDGSVITSSSSSYQEGIGRSAGVVRLTNSTWTAAYFRSQVLDTAPVVDLVNGKFYYSYYANQWLSSLSVSGADSELRTYAPDAPASGQTLTLKGTLNVTFPAGLNGFTNATGAVHAPIKATTVDMGSLSTVNISATGYAVGTYPLVAAYNAMTLPTPTTTSIAVDAGKYGRLVLTDSDKTLALQIGNITAVTIPTMAISHEKTGADLKQTITIDPEGAYTVDYTAGAWTDYGTYTATCTLTDTVAYKWADGTTTPKKLFFVITHPVSDTEPSRYRAVEYVETVVTNGTNKATAVNTGIRPQDNIKADFNVAFTRLQALNSYLLADSPGGDYRQYLLAVPYKSGDRKWGVWQMDSDPGWVYPAVSAVAVDTPYHVVVRCSGTNLSFASNAEGPTTSTIDSYSRKSGDTTTLTMFALTTAGGSPSFVKFNGGSIMTNVLDYTEALAREYVPAYDTVDKKYGLWEKVTGQFISEATGTLPFAGPPRALGGLTFLPSATKPEDGVPVQFPNVAWVTDEYGETVNYRSTNYTLSYSRDGGTTPTDDLTSQGTITVTATGAGNGYTGTVSADYTITAPVTRTITVGAMANGKLPLTFGAGSDMLLFAAKGTSDGEGTLTSWTSFENLGVIPAATTSYDYALPSDWGSTVTHLRFFFAPPDKMMTAQLAYVTADQSAGTQYLDTGVRASLRTKTVLDLTAKKDGTKVLANQQIMSSIGGNSKQSCRIFVNGNRKGSYALADANGSVDSEFYGYQIFDFNHAIWTFDGSTYTFSFYRYPTGTYSELSGSATAANGRNMPDHGSMGILAPYGSYNGTLGDINSTQVYFGEPLAQVRNFVPAKGYKYANSTYTEVAGLFDTVEAKFYPSAGTADFTAGTAATLDAANLVHVYVAGQSATVKAVAVPTADPASGSSLTYTGSQQKPTITPASAAAGTYSWGTTDWTTVGNHVFTASLPSGDPTYVWSDGTTAAKVYTYTIIRADAPTITVTGYSGTYDGSAHNAVTVTGTLPDGSTTSYSTDNANWSTTMPTVKNVADSTHVYVKVTNPNYHDATGDVDATVTAKALTAAMVTVADDSWTGTARTPTVTVTDGSKLTVNADYEIVSWQNNVGVADNLTVASVTIRGKGNYSGEVTQNFNIKSVWWVWVGPTDGTWNTPANWNRLGSGIGDGYPTGTRTLPDTTKVYLNIAQFTAGTWRVNVTDNVTYISNLVDCAGSDLTLYTLNGKRVANWTYPTEINGILRLEGSARPFSAGDDFAYVQIKGEYHWKGMTAPGACSAVEFAADNALLTATGCTFAQTGTDTYKYKAFVNRGNHPARLALTNTTWKMHQEGLNVLGTSATATFSNSTMYAGIGANQFGGDFTLDDSTVALKNVASVTFPARAGFPESGQTISYGDTFVTTALRLKGAQTKLALSGSYVPTGTVAFEIPAGGFANENNSFSAIVDKSNTYFSLDVGVTGTAPIAVGGAVDLSGATLTVDASAITAAELGGRSKRIPLVRAATALTPPASANMSVTGTASGYVSRIEFTEDAKGLDLVIYKTVIVKANNTTKVYGDADPELTATVAGLNPGDTVQYTVHRDSGEDVGKYLIVPRTENRYQGDYWLNLAGDAGGFTITPAELTATITPFPVSYGSAVPTYTATYATFKCGDELPTNTPTYACAYTTTSSVGTYPITFGTAPLFKNYAVTATNEGTVTVSQASNAWTTEPSISPTTWVQGVGPTTVTSAVAAFGTDTMTITCNGTAVAGDLQTYLLGLTVGSYEVVFTVPGTGNYTELSKTIAVTVTLDAFYGSVTAGANLDWANANNWFADAGRTQDKGSYPNSTLADVYLGKSDVSGTVTYKDGTAQLKHLTMEGDIQKCAFVSLQFPDDGAAASPIVENRKGQLVFQSATLTGVGTIRGEANTTNTFLAATTTAATIGIVNDTLTAGQTATVMFGSSSSGVRAEVGYLQTGSAGTTKVVIDNALARLTSTTAASGGAGKLAFDIKLGANNLPLTAANCPLDVAGTLSVASNSTLTVDATALTQSGTYPLITAGTLTGLGADQLLVEAKVKCAANREAVVWRTAGSNVVYLDILAPVCIYDFNAANPLRATLGTDAYIATNRFKLNSKGTEYIPDGGSIRVPGLATCGLEEVGGESGFKVQWGEHLCLPVPRQQLRDRHMKIFMRLRLASTKHRGESSYTSLFTWNPAANEDAHMFVYANTGYYGNYGGRMINANGHKESFFENGKHYTNPNPFTYDEWHDLEFLQTINGSMFRKNGLVMISTANRNMTQTFTRKETGHPEGPHKYNFFGGFADYHLASDDVLRIGCDDNGEDEPLWLSQIVIYGIDGESVPTGVQKTAATAGGDYDWSTVATDNYQNEVIFAPEAAQTWTGSESASKLLRVRFNGGTATFNDLKLDYKAKIDHEIWTLEDGSHVTLNDTTFTYDETDSETGVGYLDVCGSSALTVTGTFAGANRTGIRFPEVGSGAGSVAFVDTTADTMAELIGGKAGVTQTLALTNAVVAFAKAATTNGVAGKLAITVKLGANNTTDNTVMTFAGGLKINAGSTLKVDATGVTTPGVYPLVAAGEWLDASAETLVSSANVSVPSGWVYVVRTVDNRVELVLMSNVFTWIGEDGGSWTNQINWIREGAEAPSYGFPSSAQHIAKFTNGTYRVITEAVSNTTYKIKEILDDPGTNVRIVNKTYANTGVIGVEAKDPNYAGVITLESTESAWGWNQGEYDAKHYDLVWAYYASGVFLGYGVPKILNELHVLNHRYKYPAAASIGFGADNALMTFTGCSFNQGYWTGPAVSLCNTNDITWRTRLAITNTSWYSEFAAPNSLGTNAVVSIAQHSNIRMGMNADAFGGSFTIDDSLAAFNNSMPSEHGDTVNLTGLTVLGDSAKFVLSGNATLTGPLTFTMPALGFTNDLASVSNGQGSANTKFGPAVTNLDIAFAGVAPVAIMKDLDLSAATLAVDATAVATAVGRYPLVRANGTLTALSATPTVTGVTGAYVGLVEASADGKGYDLIIANTVAKPTADTPLYYTGDEQAGVADGTGYTVTDGTKTQPGDYTATVSLAADYRWAETPTDTNDLKLAWTILAQYKVTCDGLEVVVNKSWTDAALGVEAKQSPVQEKLNAYNNTHNLIKYWEVYAVGFAAEKASEAAPVVQPVQTTDATKLRLNLGADWPATSAQPTDSGVKVKYELHNAQTVGAEHHAIQENAAPQFDIPLSGWTSNVQYYRIRLVFEKKVVSEKL